MKLKNNLIVTLPDFAKHFDYNEFWENRRQFIRDMHPSKVYYWNNELINAYDNIVLWINGGERAEESIIKTNKVALLYPKLSLISPILLNLILPPLCLLEADESDVDDTEYQFFVAEMLGKIFS